MVEVIEPMTSYCLNALICVSIGPLICVPTVLTTCHALMALFHVSIGHVVDCRRRHQPGLGPVTAPDPADEQEGLPTRPEVEAQVRDPVPH